MLEATPIAARIFFVNDDAGLRHSVQEWLQWSGYTTTAAEAIALARQDDFEVVVTDLAMPHMDGLTLLKQLKEQDATVQVIFLSGQAKSPGIVRAQRAGQAFDAPQKPLITLARLNAAIEPALRHRQDLQATVIGDSTDAAPVPGSAG